MATTKARKPAVRKRSVRRKKKPSRFAGRIPFSRIIMALVLAAMFFISIGAAGYVIFFRVVVASAEQFHINRPAVFMVSGTAPPRPAVERLSDHSAKSTRKQYTGEAV